MKVSSIDEDRMVITRRFIITENEPVVPMAYSRPPKKVRIEKGSIDYVWQDGGWVVRNEWAVSLVGTVLLKNGQPGKNTHSRHAESDSKSWREPVLVLADGWEWLDEIVCLLRPEGIVPSMLVLGEHEITP